MALAAQVPQGDFPTPPPHTPDVYILCFSSSSSRPSFLFACSPSNCDIEQLFQTSQMSSLPVVLSDERASPCENALPQGSTASGEPDVGNMRDVENEPGAKHRRRSETPGIGSLTRSAASSGMSGIGYIGVPLEDAHNMLGNKIFSKKYKLWPSFTFDIVSSLPAPSPLRSH